MVVFDVNPVLQPFSGKVEGIQPLIKDIYLFNIIFGFSLNSGTDFKKVKKSYIIEEI